MKIIDWTYNRMLIVEPHYGHRAEWHYKGRKIAGRAFKDPWFELTTEILHNLDEVWKILTGNA